MMLANLRTKTETTSEICWEKSCHSESMRPKAGSARSSDSGANPGDEITGESSSGTNSSFMRNLTKVGPQLEKKLVLIECRVMEPIWASPQQINNHSSWPST